MDKVETVGRIHPVITAVVDFELDIGRDQTRLDGREIGANDSCRGVSVREITRTVSLSRKKNAHEGMESNIAQMPVPVPTSNTFCTVMCYNVLRQSRVTELHGHLPGDSTRLVLNTIPHGERGKRDGVWRA